MNYQTICEQNQFLFGRLEELTNEINRCKTQWRWDDIDGLLHKKASIQMMIDLNLEKLEVIWEVNNLSYKNHQSDDLGGLTKELEDMIITAHKKDPTIPRYKLAIEFNVSPKEITKVINRHMLSV